jgi:hypothetical protein
MKVRKTFRRWLKLFCDRRTFSIVGKIDNTAADFSTLMNCERLCERSSLTLLIKALVMACNSYIYGHNVYV